MANQAKTGKVVKIKEFFAHPMIKTAFGIGFCIILLAVASKRILHEPFSNFALTIPGFVLIGFEYVYAKKEYRKYARPLWWNLGMIASSCGIIAYYYFT